MKIIVYVLSLLGCVEAISANDTPRFDGRIQRAEFVSSLIKQGDIGAEIGVAAGGFAYNVLLKMQPSKLYLIDPWQYGMQADVETLPLTPEIQKNRDQMYLQVCNVFAPYPNVEVIRAKSQDVANQFPDQYFDYVYIDGEHSYEAVKRDLNNYYPKVKVGGHIIGDDYGWAGIADAVQEFLKAHKDEIYWYGNPYHGKTGGQFAIRRLK